MSKNDIVNIDLEIKKLKEKKKELIAKRERELGAYLLRSWNVEDKTNEAIFKLIDENKPIKNIKNGDKNEQNRQDRFKNQTSGREEKSS